MENGIPGNWFISSVTSLPCQPVRSQKWKSSTRKPPRSKKKRSRKSSSSKGPVNEASFKTFQNLSNWNIILAWTETNRSTVGVSNRSCDAGECGIEVLAAQLIGTPIVAPANPKFNRSVRLKPPNGSRPRSSSRVCVLSQSSELHLLLQAVGLNHRRDSSAPHELFMLRTR